MHRRSPGSGSSKKGQKCPRWRASRGAFSVYFAAHTHGRADAYQHGHILSGSDPEAVAITAFTSVNGPTLVDLATRHACHPLQTNIGTGLDSTRRWGRAGVPVAGPGEASFRRQASWVSTAWDGGVQASGRPVRQVQALIPHARWSGVARRSRSRVNVRSKMNSSFRTELH